MEFLARIDVTLRQTVNDPQGLVVRNGLHSLGFPTVETVRVGKYIEMRLRAEDETVARAQVEQMCRKLLANPVIEDFSFEVSALSTA